ncbi:MAG: amidohydrolase family protein [Candidatus Bathyarchaeia archaeon]
MGCCTLAEHRPVYASDLDSASPNNPMRLIETSFHQGTANSYALKLANITKDMPELLGGIIDRYPDGTPMGLLKETAMELITNLIPPFTKKQYIKGLENLCQEINSKELMTVLILGISLFDWNAYQKVLAEDKLTVRSFVL